MSDVMMEKRISLVSPDFTGNERRYANECLEEGWISSSGRFVSLFEETVARYVETRYGVATSSGTAALHTALMVLGIGPGDEVIVPTLTFIATANVVRYVGATPVFVDSEPRTGCLDPRRIEEKIGTKTRAIIPVHLYGHPADMDLVMGIARKYDLHVIEDATESLGSLYRGRKTGSLGDIACFSFNGNKIITTGGGGMLVTSNPEWAERARQLTTQARTDARRYLHSEVAYNYRLTNLQAAVGLGQMERIEGFVSRRRENGRLYDKLLGGVRGAVLPVEEEWAHSNVWMYTLRVPTGISGKSSREVMAHLEGHGIQTGYPFTPLHLQPPYQPHGGGNFIIAERISGEGLHLPCHPGLGPEEIESVAETLIPVFR